jgi:hypothetical protein
MLAAHSWEALPNALAGIVISVRAMRADLASIAVSLKANGSAKGFQRQFHRF